MDNLVALISVLNDVSQEAGNTSPRSTHKRTQATPSAPLQATENTDQQSPDDADEVEPQVNYRRFSTIKLNSLKLIHDFSPFRFNESLKAGSKMRARATK